MYADPDAAERGDYSTFQNVEYLPACHGCSWTGESTEHENAATEAAHHHAFPGFETLPVLPRLPHGATGRQVTDMLRLVERLYPAGWVERHGPVRTLRSVNGTRHVPAGAPTGGYDLCAGIAIEPDPQAGPTQTTLF